MRNPSRAGEKVPPIPFSRQTQAKVKEVHLGRARATGSATRHKDVGRGSGEKSPKHVLGKGQHANPTTVTASTNPAENLKGKQKTYQRAKEISNMVAQTVGRMWGKGDSRSIWGQRYHRPGAKMAKKQNQC